MQNKPARQPTRFEKNMNAASQFIRDFVQGDHECRGSIEECQKAGNGECIVCGTRDCPHGEALHYHHDGCPACFSEYQKNMSPLEKKLEIATKALNFYAQRDAFCYPQGWNWAKNGEPGYDDLERCSYVAEAALHDIAAIDAPDEEDK